MRDLTRPCVQSCLMAVSPCPCGLCVQTVRLCLFGRYKCADVVVCVMPGGSGVACQPVGVVLLVCEALQSPRGACLQASPWCLHARMQLLGFLQA